MARLNLKAIEERVAPLGGRESYDREFIFELPFPGRRNDLEG